MSGESRERDKKRNDRLKNMKFLYTMTIIIRNIFFLNSLLKGVAEFDIAFLIPILAI